MFVTCLFLHNILQPFIKFFMPFFTHLIQLSMELSTHPQVHGTNKLLSQIVRWSDVRKAKQQDITTFSHAPVLATEDALTIADLTPGAQYRVVIEAVVSVKTSLEPDKWDGDIERNRRTAHVMSKVNIFYHLLISSHF